MSKQENTAFSIVKDALILFAITIIAGIALAFVHEITLKPIADAEAKAKADAYRSVYTDAADFKENSDLTELVKTSSDTLEAAGVTGAAVDEVLEAFDNSGNIVGHVMTITGKEGYGGDIKITLGVTSDGTITGMTVLSMSETAGLGAKCTEPEFSDQFKGKQTSEVKYTKSGSPAEDEIQAISGATITTNAVTKAVNAGLYFVNNCITQ